MESSYADRHRVSTWDLPDEAAISTWTAYASALLAVQHPALARVVEAEASAGTARLVVEAEPGDPVDTWVARAEPSVPARLAVLRACASALDALHAGAGSTRGAAHGDLRPANVLVRPDESTAVTGFAPWITEEGRFTAPELRAGAASTTAGDAFAFARLTAEVLLGPDEVPDETEALVRVLRTHPHTRRRPRLVAAIRDVLSGPPETRPRGLQVWLTEGTEGAETDHGAVDAPVVPPRADPRPRSTVVALSAGLLLLAALVVTVIVVQSRPEDPGRRDGAEPVGALTTRVSWYASRTCFTDQSGAGTAMRSGGSPIDDAGAGDAALSRDGGRWGQGVAKVTLTSNAREPLVVIRAEIVARSMDPPDWVLLPDSAPCEQPGGSPRHYVVDLDDPRHLHLEGTKTGQQTQPPLTIAPDRSATLAVAMTACETNREWRLRITYYLPESGDREFKTLTPPLRMFSRTEPRTSAFSGTQHKSVPAGTEPRPAGCAL